MRLLATRSLAFEFEYEQARGASPSKIEESCRHILSPGFEASIPQKGNGSEVSGFVQTHTQFTAKTLAKRAINNGITYLVFERFFKHRLQQLGLSSTCKSVSAIFGLNINQFRILRYNQMPTLVDSLLSDNVQITLQAEDASERRIARQADYNREYGH